MSKRPAISATQQQTRSRIAAIAARLIVQSAAADARSALRQAAAELGVRDPRLLPDSVDLQAEVTRYRQLFAPQTQSILQAQRRVAVQAMEFFAAFKPRLIGPVLSGVGDASSPVVLLLLADDPDAVVRLLHEHAIPFGNGPSHRFLREQAVERLPSIEFSADGVSVELLVVEARDRLRDVATGEAIVSASRAQLCALLDPSANAG